MAELLRSAMAERGVKVRALARALAGAGATDRELETERRALNKYLHEGVQPKPPQAARIARALGLPDGYFVRPISRRPRREQELMSKVDRLEAENAELRRGMRDGGEEPVGRGELGILPVVHDANAPRRPFVGCGAQ